MCECSGHWPVSCEEHKSLVSPAALPMLPVWPWKSCDLSVPEFPHRVWGGLSKLLQVKCSVGISTKWTSQSGHSDTKWGLKAVLVFYVVTDITARVGWGMEEQWSDFWMQLHLGLCGWIRSLAVYWGTSCPLVVLAGTDIANGGWALFCNRRDTVSSGLDLGLEIFCLAILN